MSSYDKVVKLACKPKAAPPKPKYLDTILAATWSEDGAVHDVCKALSPRFREPNAIVVFKALIVLHTMFRNGATDNVLSYLSSSEVLRLKNVSGGNWEGYNTPQNLQHYAIYLDSRIRAYRDLKHDCIHVQSESNRDQRNTSSIEEDKDLAYRAERPEGQGHTRSKTIMGRKLRVMTVDKGLLRETKVLQRMVEALVECRFYMDDLGDELTVVAFRMLVKDLLILFQAGNEGVINVLEHYFEMSHSDAEQALAIYRLFCKQAEKVVEFLTVAKKLQNIVNVPVPNLKHAPVSLAGALEEYLNDPNFEQNRIEYKANKAAADKNTSRAAESKNGASGSANGSVSSKGRAKVAFAESQKPERSPSTSSQPAQAAKPANSQAMQDFFSAIEEEQPTMFNPQTGSPSAQFQQVAPPNPFGPFGPQPTGMQPQPTGFMMPQMTAFQPMNQPNPFGLQVQQQQEHRPFSSFLPSQMQSAPTGFQQAQPTLFQQPLQAQTTSFQQPLQPQPTSFLQPLQAQATGSNPFRQSMMMPQTTGFPASPFGQPQQQQQQNTSSPFQMNANQPSPFAPSALPQNSVFNSSSAFSSMARNPSDVPARPASTPLTTFGPASTAISPPEAQPVKTHQTGSRNPFGVPVAPAPPVPKAPTMMELYMNGGSLNSQATQPRSQTTSLGGPSEFGAFNAGPTNDTGTGMASVASSFSQNKAGESKASSGTFPFLNAQNTATTSSGFSDSIFSSLSTQPTGATTTSGSAAPSMSPTLKPQMTGFSGLKAFKPSSSFGASLLESLPPIPGSSPGTPGANPPTGTSSPPSAFGNGSFMGNTAFSSQPTGVNAQPTGAFVSSLGSGLRPQMTGGAANPFRAQSMYSNNATGVPNGSAATGAFANSNSTPSFTGALGPNGAPNGAPF
ncbi:ANTH-domain-containing protein, partial [Athelia psychrophila]